MVAGEVVTVSIVKIRFRSSVSDSSEDANVDNVKIVGTIAAARAASLLAAPLVVAQPQKTESLADLEDSLAPKPSQLRTVAPAVQTWVASSDLRGISPAVVDELLADDRLLLVEFESLSRTL